ncbi:MAG: ATP-binding cassette domain-containing protein [Ilumatobacteraceae bacterium]
MSAVSCRLGNTQAVDDVTLEIAEGERVAITGPNGAGKSSLLRVVIGLLPARGSVAVDGVVATDRAGWKRRRQLVAWVPQRPAVGRFPLLVRELLASSGAPDAATEAADRLGVGHLVGRPLNTLSGGQLQRVYLARGLGHVAAGARVLLADEPTSALDFDTRDAVAALLTTIPVTTLVVTHDAAVADGADRVFEMAAGRLREVHR